MRKVTEDFRSRSLIGVFLSLHPSKGRSTEEVEELDAIYQRGDHVLCVVVELTLQILVEGNLDEDSEDEYSENDNYNEAEIPYLEPCPTCDPANPYDYVCPVPIPTEPGLRITELDQAQGHNFCTYCGDIMPIQNIPEESCESCGNFSCFGLRKEDTPEGLDAQLFKAKGIHLLRN